MRPRLVVLLLVAVTSGVVAGFVGKATAGKTRVRDAVPAGFLASYGPCPIPGRFRDAFVKASHASRLPLAMLFAVAKVESEFQPNARSSAGADGLLQILPSTARELNIDASTPAKNVLAGAHYLRILLDRFKSTELALAAYNAGPTAVAKAGGATPAVAKPYVDEVMRYWRTFNGCR
jgi:soluble lytic murein transglycosylase-like protein